MLKYMHKLQLVISILGFLKSRSIHTIACVSSPSIPSHPFPVMTLVTNILDAALQTGLQERFHSYILYHPRHPLRPVRRLSPQCPRQLSGRRLYRIRRLQRHRHPLCWPPRPRANITHPRFPLCLRSLCSVVLPDSPANVGTANPASRK
ncbi:uncharacterized protein EDB91DRAFT_189783 [Suillus paluster]|uniref:uncharacterized protein n=1 Tax=Suillus paluster TaxID=48578 RepID=UPI001B86CA33|nr:uncharacterized protein EDB91DRAFT_189783 [Suillus paluster]KAG1744554.1 hypothetical protein EDB91DRAFT_189783 [Suillus paluster]